MFYTDKIIGKILLIFCVAVFLPMIFFGIKKNELEELHNEFKENKKYVVKSTIAYNDEEKTLLLEKADENGYKLIRIEKRDYIFEKNKFEFESSVKKNRGIFK